jgi:hypothetical protein
MARYAVRKIDTSDDRFYIVDLNVDGAVLISPESIVESSLNYLQLQARCHELNKGSGTELRKPSIRTDQ